MLAIQWYNQQLAFRGALPKTDCSCKISQIINGCQTISYEHGMLEPYCEMTPMFL